MTIDTANVPSLDPGESYVAHATCDQFTNIDPDHPTDWEYDFVVKAQVNAVANETTTDDNSVWYPDDDVVSYDEEHDSDSFTDTFDPQPMTFYSLDDGWPSVPSPTILSDSLGNYNTPVVLADLDNDGEDEIIVRTSSGYLSVFTGDGSTVSGWPKYIGTSSIIPSVGDIDTDSNLEIVCYGDEKVRAFNHNGSTVLGWSTPLTKTINTDIVVANLNGTGKDEIIFGAGTYLYAYNGNRAPYSSWTDGLTPGRLEVTSGSERVQSISVTNLDQSSASLEVLYHCTTTSLTHYYGCYDASGSLLFSKSNLPEGLAFTYSLDVGGDNDQETFYKTGASGHQLQAWDSDGIVYEDFTATTDENQTIRTDIVHGTIGSDDDEVEVIAVIAVDGQINAWNLDGFREFDVGDLPKMWPPLIAAVDNTDGPDLVGVYFDGTVQAFDYDGDIIEEYTFTIHDSGIKMGAIGNIDDDDEAEFVFVAGDKVIALELEGLASDIQWGQYRHDASHDNAD